ncbi:hypothetical protein N7509_011184 [Penicillium cosmopolitanum]|uniref:Uncharacterized protein n=1 Tax=Penicillium cosmopolitanum TaxID=1131564 RepID=A0A9W9VSR6_9EURO|nr:uncharacterized protein N7509_011184 [Penicillium cosmopolitanum]KAJ5388643.1 hypothetical protein N7509_011184 [Penicillium cosmopolitanum]
MAPRRGGGSYSSSSGGSSSVWATETEFSLDIYSSKSLFIAGFAFDILFALALIGFLTWSCLIRGHNGQMKGVVVTLVAWLCAQITSIVYQIFFLAEATITQYYNIDLMLQVFFSDLAIVMVVFVFYNLIHRLLNRLTDSGKPYAAIAIVHWIILGILAVISLAAWAMFVVVRVRYVQGPYGDLTEFSLDVNKVDGARTILFFVVSLEIFAWILFAAIKAGSHRFTSRVPVYALLGGSICWFALTLTNAVVYIRYYIEIVYVAPDYLQTALAILQFLFGVGTLVGILLCCQKWRHVDDSMGKPQAVTVQYPYGSGPYQQYPGYEQQFQPYPGQPQPQYPQQYQQPVPVQPYQQQPSPLQK